MIDQYKKGFSVQHNISETFNLYIAYCRADLLCVNINCY